MYIKSIDIAISYRLEIRVYLTGILIQSYLFKLYVHEHFSIVLEYIGLYNTALVSSLIDIRRKVIVTRLRLTRYLACSV